MSIFSKIFNVNHSHKKVKILEAHSVIKLIGMLLMLTMIPMHSDAGYMSW